MKSCVIVFPGSNCDRDMEVALRDVFGSNPQLVWHADSNFDEVDLITLPGGFSYGDYLRCGAIASKSPVMQEVVRRAKRGIPVLGVCNGFQILTETGLLPGALIRNSNLRYVCKNVYIKVESADSIFTNEYTMGQIIKVPVAHGDGNYFADNAVLDHLEDKGRILFRYSDVNGNQTNASNPNGSQRNIAGILNEKSNVLGMMPHPERASDRLLGGSDGALMFKSLLSALPL